MRYNDIDIATELNKQLKDLRAQRAKVSRGYMDSTLKVRLIGDPSEADYEMMSMLSFDEPVKDHGQAKVPVNSDLRSTLIQTIEKILEQQIMDAEDRLRQLGVTF